MYITSLTHDQYSETVKILYRISISCVFKKFQGVIQTGLKISCLLFTNYLWLFV